MINFSFNVDNPFTSKICEPVDLFFEVYPLSKNKHLEVQVAWFAWQTIFSLHISTNWQGRDHAGPELEIDIFGLTLSIKIYDNRHWNYQEKRWYFPNEQQFSIK